MAALSLLPRLNACLNGLSAFFLTAGYLFIRRKKVLFHRTCMTAAFVSSSVFLVSYLYYHAHAGSIRFRGIGWIRPVYFVILISHSFLAAVIVPLALMTLTRAWRRQFDRHVRWARWTLPLWMYVSVTGIVIYWLLYSWPT